MTRVDAPAKVSAMSNATLPSGLAAHTLPSRLGFEASPLGGPVARLTHGDFQALVALHGAQVLNWTCGGDGLLWLSPVARIRDGKGIRGGIPVCWPWFADHLTDASKPAHGFVRHRAWSVASTHSTPDGVSITLTTATTDGDRSMWPHSAEVLVTVTLGDMLTVAVKTRNTGTDPFPLTEALHTYFRVSDIANVSVIGLEGVAYLDKLEGFARKQQAGPILFAGEVDRIYLGRTSPITIFDNGPNRRIVIESAGSGSAVVWNPWTEKTARLGDMGSPDAFRQMLCVETANAGDDIVMLGPGETHTLGAVYRIG
jgi:D-hexose-6-phosphate mutarotase